MTKTTFWSRLALLFCLAGTMTLTTACGDDEEENNVTPPTTDAPVVVPPTTTNDLVGTWSQDNSSFVFTNNTLTITLDGRQTYQGTYSYADGKLTYPVGENNEGEDEPAITVYTVKFLYNKSVLVLKNVPDWADDYSLADVAVVLYKDGKVPTTSANDIQGTWHWYMQGNKDYIRTGVIITGNRIEIIITPWAQRHVGTFTYEGGVLHLNITEAYSARGEDGNGFGEGELDPATLECSHWYPSEDILGTLETEMPFIAGDGEAYGYVANLPAVFVKK